MMELRALTEAVFLHEINSVVQVSDQNPADMSLHWLESLGSNHEKMQRGMFMWVQVMAQALMGNN